MSLELYVVNAIATWTTDAPAFTVPVTMFIKKKFEKCLLVHEKMKKRHQKFAKTVGKYGSPSWKESSSRSLLLQIFLTERRQTLRRAVYQRHQKSRKSAFMKISIEMERNCDTVTGIIIVPHYLSHINKEIQYQASR